MRAVLGYRAVVLAIGMAIALFALGGCSGLLGDFSVSTQSGAEDSGVSGDSSVVSTIDGTLPEDSSSPGSDGTVPMNESGADTNAPPQDAPGDAPPAMAAHLTAALPTLDFGTLTVSQPITAGTIDITNTGTVKSAALTTALTGAAYSVVTDGCKGTVLAPGIACHIQIALNDGTAGMPAGTFTVTDTATDAVTVNITANVLTPGALTISPQMKDFLSWVVGASSPSQTFTVTNTGMTTSGMISIVLTPTNGTAATEFPVTDGCTGKSLAPNGTCLVSVLLTPASAGAKSASLVVNASPGGPATASLTGTGLAPAALMITPMTYGFPTTTVGTAAPPSETFVVTNTGDVPSAPLATALSITAGGSTDFAVTSDGCKGMSIGGADAGTASCSIKVEFNPAAYGNKGASLSVTPISDAGAASPTTATMTGTGQDSLSLTVTTSGTGGGTVKDSTGAIDCPGTCTASFPRTTMDPVVSLTETPNGTSQFGGWTGCPTGSGTTCAITLSGTTTAVNAEFDVKQETLSFAMYFTGAVTASVTSNPASAINCTGPCSVSPTFPVGTMVTITATPNGNLYYWTGACAGSGTTCTITMNAAYSVGLYLSHNNYMFISSTTSTADLGGLAGADATCAMLAKNAGLPGSYQALLAESTPSSVALTSRLAAAGARGWVRVDGQPFVDTIAELTSGATLTTPDVTELGTTVSNAFAWTGANGDGTPAAADCAGWTLSSSPTLYALFGENTEGEQIWYSYGGTACSGNNAIYCFGTTLSNPLTYTKTTGRYAFLSTANFNTANGLSGGTTGVTTGSADVLCQTEASNAGLPGTYLALLATTTASAASRFTTTGPTWVLPDGVPLATTAAGFMTGNLSVSLTEHANGSYADANGYARTGAFAPPDTGYPTNALTSPAGSGADTCNDWTTGGATNTGSVGWQPQINEGFFGYRGGTAGGASLAAVECGASQPVYCLQE